MKTSSNKDPLPGKIDTLLMHKNKRKRYYSLLILFSLIVAVAGILMIKYYTGYASYTGEGGFISEINFRFEGTSDYWAGLYGIALRLDGYTEPWEKTIWSNEISQGIFLFNCMQPRINHELYASIVNQTEIDWGSIQPATPADIDTFLNVSPTDYFSAANMFTSNISISVGTANLTVPATFTLMYNQTNSTRYGVGLLKDGLGHLVFVSNVNTNIDLCYYGGVCNYQMLLPVRNGRGYNETYHFFTDPFDQCRPSDQNFTVPDLTRIQGNVTDADTGLRLQDALIVILDYTTSTNANGEYAMDIPVGNYYIFGIRGGYDTYWSLVNFSVPNITYYYNIALSPHKSGDYTRPSSPNQKTEDYPQPPEEQQPKTITALGYLVSISEINRKIRQGNFIQEVIRFTSTVNHTLYLSFTIDGEAANIIELDTKQLILEPGATKTIVLTIFGKGEPRTVKGSFNITGGVSTSVPINIEILKKEMLPVEALLLEVLPFKTSVEQEALFKFRVNLQNLLTDQQYPVSLLYTIQDANGSKTYWALQENTYVYTRNTIIKSVKLPPEMKPGDYVVTVTAEYLGLASADSATFEVVPPKAQILYYKLFNLLPLWMLLLAILLLGILFVLFLLYKKFRDRNKKYKIPIAFDDLPKEGPTSLYVGKVAETSHKTYFEMTELKMHTIIAGSTGSGKSFTTQIVAEELLDKNVAVLVFDPTAQWTGMLRSCKDKSILNTYKQFYMEKSQAKPFNGGLRKITNPFEEIDLAKYIKPGEIQVFVLNSLEPEEVEIFVSNVIRQVFKQKFPESKDLKLVLVFDEVHRLLPKFGGSGIGFMQIERGLREFRKWGIGLVLISHVLNDFLDQIRANISTHVQMKTRDENDLERIRVKHNEQIFRAMVKTRVGTGLVVNADYNRGNPYFVDFRPIKHDLIRLSEEEIAKYQAYNEKIDQVDYEIAQLEELKQDVFNSKLELKLLLKKLKEGNFYVVDIYLEEINGELQKMWQKLKKQPKKKEIKLIDKKEIEREIKKAEEERISYISKNKPQTPSQDYNSPRVPLSKALNFENGASVQSLQELIDVLQSMTDSIFKKHVNPSKNDVASWIKHSLNNPVLAAAIEKSTDKEEMVLKLNNYKETFKVLKDGK